MNALRSIVAALLVVLGEGSFVAAAEAAPAPYAAWNHSGSLFILTTPDGADLPAEAVVKEFPLLVRLHDSTFDFAAARPDGSDLRFATAAGAPLAYQIEAWDAAQGEATVWVRIPVIRGNARQELRAFWGNAEAKSESSGQGVFNPSNGYLSVWHLDGAPTDDVGTLESQDIGTTPARGMIAGARHFAGKQGVFCGENITGYPTASSSHSTQAWFRAEKSDATLISWGNDKGGHGGKVQLWLRNPSHIHIGSMFRDMWAEERLPMNEWIHVVHTYSTKDKGRVYLNGRLAGEGKPALNINTPLQVALGGWNHKYDFLGDLDEVRVSSVERSADWVRLEYENQKAMQTLVGPIVPAGSEFAVSTNELTIDEGQSVTVTAQAGGAQKLAWVLIHNGGESVIAVDRLTCRLDAGRVAGDSKATLELRAVYPDGVKSKAIAIAIKEKIAEPEFVLKAPASWNGTSPIEVAAVVGNLAALETPEERELEYRWSVSGPAVVKEIVPGKLLLRRAMGSGALSVTLRLDNGGTVVERTATIDIPTLVDAAAIERKPEADERPMEGQFYARNDQGFGTLIANGALTEAEAKPAGQVFLRVFSGDERIANETRKLGPDKTYAFAVPLKAGLVKYRSELGTVAADGTETILHRAADLLCGDAFVVVGQSNAVATDFGPKELNPPSNEWVRTFGATDGSPQGSRLKLWAPAQARPQGGISGIGYWGLDLGRRLVESQSVPICIINGAVGGTRIDQHLCNPADLTDVATIYGRLLWRVREARLTHGIRAIVWHQGESDQGADGPTGLFGWETYREYFHQLAGSWQSDYPNARNLYLFQIWPKSCSMGIRGSDNVLREVQRTLPRDFKNLGIVSTLGIRPPGGCHFPAAGYAEFARMLAPRLERDLYARRFTESITPPNLLRAEFTSGAKDEITLEFDQPVEWNERLANQFYLNGVEKLIAGGSVQGNTLTLRLTAPSSATKITYLDSKSWNQDNLLVGVNGLAALTFCDVVIEN